MNGRRQGTNRGLVGMWSVPANNKLYSTVPPQTAFLSTIVYFFPLIPEASVIETSNNLGISYLEHCRMLRKVLLGDAANNLEQLMN